MTDILIMSKKQGNWLGKILSCLRKIMLKKFISFYKPYWKLFALDISCAFLIATIDLAFPLITIAS